MRDRITVPALAGLLVLPVGPVGAADGDADAGAAEQGSAAPGREEAKPESSVRDIYREQHALFGDRFTIEPSLTYTHSDRNQLTLSGFLALDAIFLGNISVDSISRDSLRPELALRYDVTDRLQLEGVLPYVYRRSEFESTGQTGTDSTIQESVSSDGIGDVRLSLFYRLLNETAEQPDVVLNLGVTAPTGEDPFGVPTETRNGGRLEFPSELPTGNGVWAVSFGASFLKTLDPAIVFASLGAEVTLEEDFDDISADPGDQPGDVDLGDTVRFGFGTAFAVNQRLSLSLSLDQSFTTESEQQLDGGPATDVVGSDATASVLNVGGTLSLDADRSLTTNVGFGLTEDAPDVSVRVSMPIGL